MFEWFGRRTSPHLAALSQASIPGETASRGGARLKREGSVTRARG
jgi:hypothetical protein